jgi:citrate lyase subunit beta/citryl-CoA lyase
LFRLARGVALGDEAFDLGQQRRVKLSGGSFSFNLHAQHVGDEFIKQAECGLERGGGFWGDLGASLGVIPSNDGSESLYLRSKVLVDVRAAGVRFPIGGGTVGRSDIDGVRAFMRQNKHLGYTGAHVPNSAAVIAAVNDVFTPTAAELEDWQRRLPVLEAAQRDGRVAFMHEGAMYDTAGIGRVRAQLALAGRLGLA